MSGSMIWRMPPQTDDSVKGKGELMPALTCGEEPVKSTAMPSPSMTMLEVYDYVAGLDVVAVDVVGEVVDAVREVG